MAERGRLRHSGYPDGDLSCGRCAHADRFFLGQEGIRLKELGDKIWIMRESEGIVELDGVVECRCGALYDKLSAWDMT